jgi:hypothetical protein
MIDPALVDARQLEERTAADFDDIVKMHVRDGMRRMHTSCPAIVQSFDPVARTISAQPVTQVLTANGFVSMPLLVDVPIQFLGGGGFFLEFPIAPGDEVLICFSESCIDRWWVQGLIGPPDEYRFHDLSDGMAIAGFDSRPRTRLPVDTSNVRLVTRATVLGIISAAGALTWNGNVTINGALQVSANATVTGGVTAATVNALASMTSPSIVGATVQSGTAVLATHTHSAVTTGTANSGPPTT